MSDFGLLMTGMLATGQQSSPSLPEQPLVSHESAVQQVTLPQTLESISSVQITPPEFMQAGDRNANLELSLKNKVKNTVSSLIAKMRLMDSSSVMPINSTAQQQVPLSSQLLADDASTSDLTSQHTLQSKYQRFHNSSLPTLKFGNSGISVRVLQKLLLSNGYGLGVDGFFGAVTETAVKAFQSQRNLVADGIVGQKTWAELAN